MDWSLIKITDYALVVALVSGLVSAKRLKWDGYLILLLVFLTLAAEIYGSYLKSMQQHTTAHYNLFMIVSRLYIAGVYTFFLTSSSMRKWACLGILVIGAISAYNYGWEQGADTLNTYSIAPVGLLSFAHSYLIGRNHLTGKLPVSSPMLGFAAGNLAYYTLALPVICAMPLLNRDIALPLKYSLNDTGYILWSLCISIGFIWKKK